MKKKIVITGGLGYIGTELCKLYSGVSWHHEITVIDNRFISERVNQIRNWNMEFIQGDILDLNKLTDVFNKYNPEIVFHLAAQAGVRYSIENPKAYMDSNIIGTYNIIELGKKIKIKHLLIASSSSVYGANKKLPFTEIDKTETQLSLYAATKKSTESIAHSYSNILKIPITMLRFFTVYGPWGRPDMALFKFTKAILNNDEIQFNITFYIIF